MKRHPQKIAVIGAGSWGTALAKHLAEKSEQVCLWAHEPEVANGIQRDARNPLFLSDVLLPQSLRATSDLSDALDSADAVISVVPSHAVRTVWKRASAWLSASSLFVSCTKGIEPTTYRLMSQVLDECLPDHPSGLRTVLSGPSFAREVAVGLPTIVVIAGADTVSCARAQQLFRTDTFLPFTSDDIIGVQVGAAIKNVVAIAAGVSDGLHFGHNARAATITRGLYEMIKVGEVLGAKRLTFAGLSGIGDLVLTCTGEQSRNYMLGRAIGEGKRVDEVQRATRMVAEGVVTAKAVERLRKKYRLHLPICHVVYRLLEGTLTPPAAVQELTALPLGEELGAFAKPAGA